MPIELALVVYDHQEGAELAYGAAKHKHRDSVWLREAAFVEMHHGGRVSFRGTFGDRYVSQEEIGDATGPNAAAGALTGGVVGGVFGPPGFVLGLIVGLMAGGRKDAEDAPEPQGEFFDQLRGELDHGQSAIILLAESSHVDEMLAALSGTDAKQVRHPVDEELVKSLEQSLPYVPPAKPGEYL